MRSKRKKSRPSSPNNFNTLMAAVQHAITIMGPRILSCMKCKGCELEMTEALRTLYVALLKLGVKHQYSDNPTFLKEVLPQLIEDENESR